MFDENVDFPVQDDPKYAQAAEQIAWKHGDHAWSWRLRADGSLSVVMTNGVKVYGLLPKSAAVYSKGDWPVGHPKSSAHKSGKRK